MRTAALRGGERRGRGGVGQNVLQKEHWTRSPRASHSASPRPLGDSASVSTLAQRDSDRMAS